MKNFIRWIIAFCTVLLIVLITILPYIIVTLFIGLAEIVIFIIELFKDNNEYEHAAMYKLICYYFDYISKCWGKLYEMNI